ncbi:hypothetical protein [Dietzia cercidiphylli]|uniref:hypothetical protein n=1 Tax=Dietzia cercidiphylli TaxID=498199 RepID=UPI00223C334F|nr:hypothetical protein [Dietzia cercidiphylli]MCT1515782.1 hypothetical protein [Dietzia cercidiphylli]
MSSAPLPLSRIIWATRGRHWGFRFLLDAGLADPMATYDRVFAGLIDSPTAFHRDGTSAAIRFLDPEGRRDAARRIIPHEFIVLDDSAETIGSVEDGERVIWPLVSGIYSRTWDAEEPPSREDLELDPKD